MSLAFPGVQENPNKWGEKKHRGVWSRDELPGLGAARSLLVLY